MAFGTVYTQPYFTGTITVAADTRYDIGLAGHSYMIDWQQAGEFRRGSVPLIRDQADSSERPGETSINPNGLWRRSVESWHHGAGQCLTPETRVLTADLQWLPVGDLAVGQRLVAFEEEATNRPRRQWQEATVTGTGRITKPCYRILMSDGTKFVASYDHQWLKVVKETHLWAESQNIQSAAKAPTKSTKLVKLMEPWDFDGSRGAGYLAAAFDGEGCLTQTQRPPRKDRLMLNFCQRQNGMLDRVKVELGKRGFAFSQKGGGGKNHDVFHLYVLGGTSQILRLLGSLRPERLLPKFQPLNNGIVYGTPVEVLECEYVGEQEVVALSTTTGTFIAEGYASHNTWLDRQESNPFRYNTSKGLDPWDPYGLNLLPATSSGDTSSDTNLYLAPSGGRLYFSEGQVVRVTGAADETFAAATGTPAATVTSLASDGATCFAGFGASGIYKATGTVFSSHITGTVGLVRYANGRLIAAASNVLYNPIAAGALPVALYTHPNTSWAWTDAAEGPSHIYLSGYAGDKSMIYKTTVKADGTALDVPTVAATLPDGELAHSVTGYQGFLLVGTTKGIRFAAPDGDGNLQLGAYIPTTSTVLCAEGQDRFVWFGWTNYDSTSTGLGRLDLRTFTSNLTPAYASDLMTTAQGAVQAVATYKDKRWFTVSGTGLFKQSSSVVTSGSITGGRVGFGLPDEKTALYLTVRHDELAASESITASLAVDAATASLVGVSDVDASSEPGDPFSLTGFRGNDFEWTLTLVGATLRSVTLRADPTAERTEHIFVPILLHDVVMLEGQVEEAVDVAAEWDYLTSLRDSRRVVTYQEGNLSRRVVVDDSEWRPFRKTADRQFYQGTYLMKLKGI